MQNARHTVPIYLINVLVSVYEKNVFLYSTIVEKVLMKGFGKKDILENKMPLILKRTTDERKFNKAHTIKIKDIQLLSQHGFGINLD